MQSSDANDNNDESAAGRRTAGRSPRAPDSSPDSPANSPTGWRRHDDLEPAGADTSPDSICPICRAQINNLCITNCNHRFCRDCIRRWTARNATCPTCRQTIHTIRNILPDGGTEVIQISRAELLAHRINETHSILMLLFTVLSHSLLPEVSSYLEQLNEIARELNIPTTLSRTSEARTPGAGSDAGAPPGARASASGSPSSLATMRSLASTSSASSSDGGSARATLFLGQLPLSPPGLMAAATSEPPSARSNSSSSSELTLRRLPGTIGFTSGADGAAQAAPAPPVSSPNEPALVSGARQQAIKATGGAGGHSNGQRVAGASAADPAPRSAEPVASCQPVPASGQTASAAAQEAGPRRAEPGVAAKAPAAGQQRPQSPPSPGAGGAGSRPALVRAAASMALAAGQQAQLARSDQLRRSSLVLAPQEHQYSSVQLADDNPRIRYTYSRPSSPAERLASDQTYGPLVAGGSGGLPAASSLRRPSAASGSFGASLPGVTQPPTPDEIRRALDQRRRDIRLLTECFNKVNQVYEVLMIMHMVVHRNQVELDTAPASEPNHETNRSADE